MVFVEGDPARMEIFPQKSLEKSRASRIRAKY